MKRNGQPETLAKTRARNYFPATGQTLENEEAANRYAMFIIGAASFFAGFWATACLISAVLHNGPLAMIKQLAAAVSGQ